jgi:hypothetical protein
VGYDAAFLLLNGRWDERYALPRVDLYPPDHGLRLRLKTEPTISLPLASLLRWKRLLGRSDQPIGRQHRYEIGARNQRPHSSRQLAQSSQSESPPLASMPEEIYFRARYSDVQYSCSTNYYLRGS